MYCELSWRGLHGLARSCESCLCLSVSLRCRRSVRQVRRHPTCSHSAAAINFLLDLYSAFDLTVLSSPPSSIYFSFSLSFPPSLPPPLSFSLSLLSTTIVSLTLTKSMLLSPPELLFCAHFNFPSLSLRRIRSKGRSEIADGLTE